MTFYGHPCRLKNKKIICEIGEQPVSYCRILSLSLSCPAHYNHNHLWNTRSDSASPLDGGTTHVIAPDRTGAALCGVPNYTLLLNLTGSSWLLKECKEKKSRQMCAVRMPPTVLTTIQTDIFFPRYRGKMLLMEAWCTKMPPLSVQGFIHFSLSCNV